MHLFRPDRAHSDANCVSCGRMLTDTDSAPFHAWLSPFLVKEARAGR
jgi:hypothetical protein